MEEKQDAPAGKNKVKELVYNLTVAGLFVTVIVAVVALGLWLSEARSLSPVALPSIESIIPPSNQAKLISGQFQYWVSCDDVRDVIEESDRLYLACLGGVLVVDHRGTVIDQFGMPDGMRSATVISLVKIGQTLYAGTQDGFSIINLTNRSIKNISVGEGLVNGANITLAEDGNYLWVGTFNGLSRYDTTTSEIRNFKTEFSAYGSTHSVNRLLVTPRFVYVSFTSSGYSRGGVARWNKQTGEFETPDPVFASSERSDIYDLQLIGNTVIGSDWRAFYMVEDQRGASWERRNDIADKVNTLIGEQSPVLKIIGQKNGQAILFVSNLLLSYDLTSGEFTIIYPQRYESEAPNDLGSAQFIIGRGNKLWFSKRANNFQVLGFDLQSLTSMRLNLAGRPARFDQVVALVNDQPIITANYGQLWQFSSKGFEKILELSQVYFDSLSPLGFAFEPIDGTSEVFLYSQGCGQGCDRPTAMIFDYRDKSVRQLTIDESVLSLLTDDPQGAFGFLPLEFHGYANNQAVFEVSHSQPRQVIYDVVADQWSVAPLTKVSDTPLFARQVCNPVYKYVDNRFSRETCQLVTSQYSWSINLTNSQSILRQTDNQTKQTISLTPTLAPLPYSPFDQSTYSARYNLFLLAQQKLWLATTLSLAVYDPAGQTWQLYAAPDGLPSLNVTSLAVGDKYLWVVAEWGGLAGIRLSQ